MRLENLCERGARILQTDIMGVFIGVRLNLLRSVAFGVMARDAKVLASTQTVPYTMPNGAKSGLGGDLMALPGGGGDMKEVNAFLGCDIAFSTSELVLSPHASSSE